MSAALVNLFHLRLFLPQNALVTPLAECVVNPVARESGLAQRQFASVFDDGDHFILLKLIRNQSQLK
jgi:hypothetical protein